MFHVLHFRHIRNVSSLEIFRRGQFIADGNHDLRRQLAGDIPHEIRNVLQRLIRDDHRMLQIAKEPTVRLVHEKELLHHFLQMPTQIDSLIQCEG